MIVPRFSGANNKDNTDRLLKRDFQAPAFAATINLAIKGSVGYTLVQPANITGAVTFTANVGDNATAPFVGDKLEFLLFNSAGTASIVTFGTGFAPNGTLSITAGKAASAAFVFNGSAWVQTGSSVSA